MNNSANLLKRTAAGAARLLLGTTICLIAWLVWVLASSNYHPWTIFLNVGFFAVGIFLLVPQLRHLIQAVLGQLLPRRARWTMACIFTLFGLTGGLVNIAMYNAYAKHIASAHFHIGTGNSEAAVQAFDQAREIASLSKSDFGLYQKQLHQAGVSLVNANQFIDGLAFLERAREEATETSAIDSSIASAKERYATTLKDKGERIAASGDYNAAVAAFTEAQKFDATIQGLDQALSSAKENIARIERQKRKLLATKLKAKGDKLVANGDYNAALNAFSEARSLDASIPDLDEALLFTRKKVDEDNRRKQAEKRRTQILAAIEEAERVGRDQELCDAPKSIADAWFKLRKTKRDDPDFKRAKKAARRLERCRKSTRRALDKELRKIMRTQRANVRALLDELFLAHGLDVEIQIGLFNDRYITFTHVFFSNRAIIRQLTRDGALYKLLERSGFETVTFEDGFDSVIYHTLNPQQEKGAGQDILTRLGIGEPLVLK